MPTIRFPNADMNLPVADIAIKRKGTYNMDTLYKAMHEWLQDRDYASKDDKAFNETQYVQRVNQNQQREIIFWWRQEKRPPDGGDRFVYMMKINCHILFMKKVDITKNGNKFNVDNGECEIVIKGNLIVDPDGKFKSHPVIKRWKKWFINEGVGAQIVKHKHLLYQDVYGLAGEIRTFFEMQGAANPNSKWYTPGGTQDKLY